MFDNMSTGSAAQQTVIAGFWRRVGAFMIDNIILALIAYSAGIALYDQFASLGAWGRVVGFAMGLGYFGLLNSRIAFGRTIGKHLLGIKVVGADGEPLPIRTSLLRFAVFGTPMFLNGATFATNIKSSPLMFLISLALFGLSVAIVYLLAFNRPTRQSLHDLIVGSYVVRTESIGSVPAVPLWRMHYIALAAIFVFAATLPLFAHRFAATQTFAGMMPAAQAVSAEPEVVYATITRNWSPTANPATTYLRVTAHLTKPPVADEMLARRLAQIVLDADPAAMKVADLQVVLVYGYDLGLASGSMSYRHNNTPADWVSARGSL